MVDDYLQISKINDFLFCPYSIYLHNIYENFEESNYHTNYQSAGKLAHETIDKKVYSTEKSVIQGLSVFSNKYKIAGKIDIFDIKKSELIERKNKITYIYDGYIRQLYAQYACLLEMGYKIRKLSLYSLTDNKKYNITIPNKTELSDLLNLIETIQNYDIDTFNGVIKAKCENCIYSTLCPYSKC